MAFSATQSQPHAHETHRARVRFGWPSSLTFPLILFVIILCFYWKLVFTYQFDWMWSPDLADQVFPWWQEEARQLRTASFRFGIRTTGWASRFSGKLSPARPTH